jgi:hypothetical protein
MTPKKDLAGEMTPAQSFELLEPPTFFPTYCEPACACDKSHRDVRSAAKSYLSRLSRKRARATLARVVIAGLDRAIHLIRGMKND